MTTTTGPQIACQRCGTTVPWGPYCPHCSAYLEFAGVPPWSPDGPPPQPEPEPETRPEPEQAPAPAEPAPVVVEPAADEELAADEPVNETAPVELPAVSILGVEVEGQDTLSTSAAAVPVVVEPVASEPVASGPVAFEPEARAVPIPVTAPKPKSATSKWLRGLRRLRPRQIGGYLFGIAMALLLTALFGLLGGWGTAWLAAPFLVLVAIVAMAAFGTVPDVEHDDELAAEAARIAAEEEAARLAAEAEAARIAAEEEAARLAALPREQESLVFTELVGKDAKGMEDIASRPPQAVERTVKAGHVKAASPETVRDVACLTCGRLNIATHRLCEYCGAPMEGAQVRPPVEPVLETRVLETEEQEKKKRRRRSGPSRSWRAPVAVIAILGVVVTAFAFAFFGPGAFQFRFGTARVYQLVARWVNPYLGETASVATVTASSNLTGAEATEAGFGDARTFWASAPATGYGAGSELVFTLNQPTEIDRMVIFPGIQNGQFDIRALATPKDVTLEFQDGTKVNTTLAEVESSQQQRQLVTFDPEMTGWVKFTINTVYPPRGQPADGVGSVAMSGSQFIESPATPQFFGVQNGVRGPSLPGAGSQS